VHINHDASLPCDTSLPFASDVITTDFLHLQILQNAAALVTKRVGWVYNKMLDTLLHNALFITKYLNCYYKMCNLSQNASLLQNASHTCFTVFSSKSQWAVTRVTVYTILARSAITTCVINAVVDVCKRNKIVKEKILV